VRCEDRVEFLSQLYLPSSMTGGKPRAIIPLHSNPRFPEINEQLGQKVILVTPLKRYIQPPDIEQLRISMRQLRGTDVEAVGKLREIFELEIKAIKEGARKHPVREVLTRVMHHTLPAAMITMISLWNHDNEALTLTLDELRRKGTDAIVIDIKRQK